MPVVGITLVVAGDSFFVTLFIVILFHQMFEGIALGTRIALIGQDVPAEVAESSASQASSQGKTAVSSIPVRELRETCLQPPKPLSLLHKLLMATAFAIITPIGMAIGIGILHQFNGNNPSTLVALGTLDALSAGILIWVGLVEMWARDWIMQGGEMVHASVLTISCGGTALVAGMVVMSVLGKWA